MADDLYYGSPAFFNDNATFFGDVTILGNINLSSISIDSGIFNSISVRNSTTLNQISGVSTALVVNGATLLSGITTVSLGATSTPQYNSSMSFELTTDTNLRVKVRGSDGVLRSGNIILA